MSAPTRPMARQRMPIHNTDSAGVQQAIQKLLQLSMEGQQLVEERKMLAEDLKTARQAIAAHKAGKPAQAKGEKTEAFQARLDRWGSDLSSLETAVARIEAKIKNWEEVKLPRFERDVENAKRDLDNARREYQSKTEERRQAEAAVQQLDTLQAKISDLVEAQGEAEKRSGDDSVRFERIKRRELPRANARRDLPTLAPGDLDSGSGLDEAAKARVLAAAQVLQGANKSSTD